MKNLIVVLSVFVAIASKAQINTSLSDSVKAPKNEIGFNLLPLVNLASGLKMQPNTKFGINYRRFLTKNNVLRLSVSYYPSSYSNAGNAYSRANFYGKTDTFNIFSRTQIKRSRKAQINIGYERILSQKRITQSIGTEIFASYQHMDEKDVYYWEGQSNNTVYTQPFTSSQQNSVDTLGATRSSDVLGIGFNMFYNVRLNISKHWILSGTIGPSFVFSYNKIRVRSAQYPSFPDIVNFDFNAHPVLISDLSICYRF